MHSTVAHNTNRILVESDDFKIYHCFYSCSIIYCYNHYNQPQAKDSCIAYYLNWGTLVVVVTPAHDAKHAFPYSWPSHPHTGSHSAIQKQSGLGSYFDWVDSWYHVTESMQNTRPIHFSLVDLSIMKTRGDFPNRLTIISMCYCQYNICVWSGIPFDEKDCFTFLDVAAMGWSIRITTTRTWWLRQKFWEIERSRKSICVWLIWSRRRTW